MIKSSSKTTAESYSNLVMTDKDLFCPTSINDVEMNELQLNCEHPGNSDNKVFYVKKTSHPNLEIDTKEFKMKHCGKVRSILFNGTKFNSIYHPRDDSHGFYIIRDKNGIFSTRDFKPTDQSRKRVMLKEEIEQFTKKFNEIVSICQSAGELRKAFIIKITMFILIGLTILLLSYNFLFILIFFLSMCFVKPDTKDETVDAEKILNFVLTAFSICLITIFYKVLVTFQGRQKLVLFKHMLDRRRDLEKEIEYWNQTVFERYNMRAFLGDTFDYVGVFYDKDIVYEIDDHFN